MLSRNIRWFRLHSDQVTMSFSYRELVQTSSHRGSAAAIDDPCLRSSSEAPEKGPLWCPALLTSHRENQYPEHGKLHDFLQRLAQRRRIRQGRIEKEKSVPELTSSARTTVSLNSEEESVSVSTDKTTTQKQRSSKQNRRRRKKETNRPHTYCASSSLHFRHSYDEDERQRFVLLIQKS